MRGERVLVVDDEPGVRAVLEAILKDEGFVARTAASGEEGLLALENEPFDAVLLDVWLPGIDGLETLVKIRERRFEAEVVMISGHATIDSAVRATKLGAFDFIEKPLSLEKTLLVLRNALRQRRLEMRNRRLMEQLARDTEILGFSAAAERLRAEVHAAASSEAPVLLCGERGTGREMLARHIHAMSRRADHAFVEVPCAALDAAAAVRTLFGDDEEPGRVQLARGGSLFLEDVEALDQTVQRRLGAVLESSEGKDDAPRRIACTVPAPDVLDTALRSRLDVIRISVPPLRERREDIPLLVERFLRDLSTEYGRASKRVDAACLRTLTAAPWPGNVRELRNLVERLLLMPTGDLIRREDLPAELGGQGGPAEDLYKEFDSLEAALVAFERYTIRRALARERGDLNKASLRLGLSVGTLASRMERLGIRPG